MIDARLGTVGVWLAFAAAVAGGIVMLVGLMSRRGPGADRRPLLRGAAAGEGRYLAPVMLVGAVVAVLAIEHALVTHDFTLVFVAQNNSAVTPLLYSITGMWSALAGSILLWGLMLSVVATAFVWRYRG